MTVIEYYRLSIDCFPVTIDGPRYIFYKSAMVVFVMFCFGFYSAFTGQVVQSTASPIWPAAWPICPAAWPLARSMALAYSMPHGLQPGPWPTAWPVVCGL